VFLIAGHTLCYNFIFFAGNDTLFRAAMECNLSEFHRNMEMRFSRIGGSVERIISFKPLEIDDRE